MGQDGFKKVITLLDMRVPQGRGQLRSRSHRNEIQEKPVPDDSTIRTKTDTGRRDEYSQALERTLVKELGKLTP